MSNTNGIESRVERIEQDYLLMYQRVSDLEGSVIGTTEKPGILPRLINLEKYSLDTCSLLTRLNEKQDAAEKKEIQLSSAIKTVIAIGGLIAGFLGWFLK